MAKERNRGKASARDKHRREKETDRLQTESRHDHNVFQWAVRARKAREKKTSPIIFIFYKTNICRVFVFFYISFHSLALCYRSILIVFDFSLSLRRLLPPGCSTGCGYAEQALFKRLHLFLCTNTNGAKERKRDIERGKLREME